jgi:hypothetical protein
MESKKINQLATELTPALDDLTIIGDPTTGISKKITLSQMASLFTGTVEEYANLAAFPLVGVADTIYIALDTNILYRWNTGTSAYVELSPNIVSSLVFNDANGFDGTINLVGSVATLTITTALTTGSVGFIGASGALLQDNANFFWDDTNNRLGLGTNAPTTALDVFGSGIIERINGTSTNNAYLGFASAGTNKWSVGNVQSDHRFRIFSEANSAELVSVLQTGEVGIGIANPLTKFHIDGGATALIANLDANVSVAKSISFRSDNSNRINLEVSGTESGSDAGANLFLRTYSDAGALLYTPLTITRSTGLVSIANSLDITGTTIIRSMSGSALNIRGDDTLNSDFGLTWTTTTYTGGIAAIRVARRGATDASDMMFFTAPNGNTPQEKLRITSTGNVGIGSATISQPSAGATTLRIVGTETTKGGAIYLDSSNSSVSSYIYPDNTSGLGINTFTAHPIVFRTTDIERMRITSAGVVGIGTSTLPYGMVTIKSNSATSYAGLNVFANSNNNFIALNHTGSVGIIETESFTGGGFTPIAFVTGGGERMRITTGGFVGIATSNPDLFQPAARNLVVGSGTGNNGLTIFSGNTFACSIHFADAQTTGAASYAGYINYEHNTDSMQFGTNSTERMRITSDAKVLMGTTTYGGVGNSFDNGGGIIVNYSGVGFRALLEFKNGNGTIGSITATGLVTTYNTTSDYRLKQDYKNFNGLNLISKIKTYDYEWKLDKSRMYGVIAHELQQVLPYAVQGEKDGEKMQGVDYSKIVPILIKAIQEQQAQIEELKAKIK